MATDYSQWLEPPTEQKHRSILLMGASGTGKSYQFRTLVKNGWNGLYANVREHLGTVNDLLRAGSDDPPHRWDINNPDVPLSPSDKDPSTQDFIRLMDYLRTPDHPYDFLFYDSLMNHSEMLEGWLKHTKRLGGYDLWAVFGEKMKMAGKLLTSLTSPSLPKPVHVIATWGVEIDTDWEGKRSVQPLVSGKYLRPRVPYMFDDVFVLEKALTGEGERKYLLHTQGTHEFSAKVSSGDVNLPAVIEKPDLWRVIQKIQGNL